MDDWKDIIEITIRCRQHLGSTFPANTAEIALKAIQSAATPEQKIEAIQRIIEARERISRQSHG